MRSWWEFFRTSRSCGSRSCQCSRRTVFACAEKLTCWPEGLQTVPRNIYGLSLKIVQRLRDILWNGCPANLRPICWKISLVNHATWFKTRCAKMYPLFFTGLHPTIFPSTPRDPASETRRISLFFGRILSEQHGHEFGRTRYSGPNKDRHTSYRQFRKFAPWRDDYNVSTLCRLNISVAYSHKLGGDKASSPLK